jgi:hypothetical protein
MYPAHIRRGEKVEGRVPRFGQEGSKQCQEKDDDDERERTKKRKEPL